MHKLHDFHGIGAPLRACLAELHATPGKKNQLHSKNFSAKHNRLHQLHRGSAQKKGGAGPNSMVFVEYLRGCSTNSKFCGVEVNYPPLNPNFLELR
jgi:hypothetical protein